MEYKSILGLLELYLHLHVELWREKKFETCGCGSVRRENEKWKGKMIMTFFSNSLHVSYREELTHGGLREKGEVQREKSSEWEVSW
jgi:hypothetical protein